MNNVAQAIPSGEAEVKYSADVQILELKLAKYTYSWSLTSY